MRSRANGSRMTCAPRPLSVRPLTLLRVWSIRWLDGANSDTKCNNSPEERRGNLGHFWFLHSAKNRGTAHEVSPDHLR